tara:strand:- start:7 stop:942 length:936 start_codon:yes stop_codon:yes gene_type:complete
MAWERLAHTEITGSAGILTSGTFTAKKNLKVILYVTGLSVVNNTAIVFNTDNASSNYGIRGSVDGGSDYSHGSQPAIVISPTAQDTSYSTFNITNIDGQEKIVIHDSTNTGGSGSGNAPSRREGAGKWATTSGQITKITVTDNNGGTGSITCGVGSYITVLGAKEAATSDTITVDTFAAKKHLMVQIKKIASGNASVGLQFNADTGNNYSFRRNVNGGTDAERTSKSFTAGEDNTATSFSTHYIINEAAKEKLVISEFSEIGSSGAGNAPDREEIVGKWANTSNQITKIDVKNQVGGDFAEGSEVTVYGTD